MADPDALASLSAAVARDRRARPPGGRQGEAHATAEAAGRHERVRTISGDTGRRGRAVAVEAGEAGSEDLGRIALDNAPPWLASALFHLAVMILLGLWMISFQARERIELRVDPVFAEQIGEQLEFASPLTATDETRVEEPLWTPDELPLVLDPLAAPPELADRLIEGTTPVDVAVPQIGLALSGREEGRRQVLLAAHGGTETTEAAVRRGLEWLARNQQRNGSWSLTGPYRDGGMDENRPAATAMALLAFQGAGHTHQRGDFRDNVARGWQWLLRQQDEDGCFFSEGQMSHRFYTQALAAIALCELYAMTGDADYREPAQKSIDYLVRTHAPEGGWKYLPGVSSDLSVTGWVVMALQSARMGGLEVPSDTFRRVEQFLDALAVRDGTRYPYEIGHQYTLAMTAEGMLCRQYLGWPRDDPRLLDAAEWFLEPDHRITFEPERGEYGRDVYYWYYATQVLHHMQGDPWRRWNAVMRQVLPEHQITEGREAGSWDPAHPQNAQWEDIWGRFGGRLYVTCLSIYMLEVYYRHLPLYSDIYR